MADGFRVSSEWEALAGRYFDTRGYERKLALDLISAGRDPAAAWNLRCLAALMLEGQFLRIPAGRTGEQRLLLNAAGCPDDPAFARMIRRRLQRHRHLHNAMKRAQTVNQVIDAYLHVAAQPCRLWFARYLFRPGEIARRILESVRISSGVREELPSEPGWMTEARKHIEELPDTERRVLAKLADHDSVYWVASQTSSEMNGLVEYPLGTVALVVKPPGSDTEFEIKRAGLGGARVLTALYARSGAKVPWPHRLQGGSAGSTIDSEARASHQLGRIYRAVHGSPAPISTVVGVNSVYGVPTAKGEADLLSYFTDRAAFGDGFKSMREALAQCVEDFEQGNADLELPGDLGLTVRFLRHLAPKQAVLCGTTSFRLDRVARYLASEGPDLYFRQGLDRDYTLDDARRLADDLLLEVLGVFQPPPEPCDSYPEYIAASLRVPANRRRADRTYIDLMRQIGEFWGTLAALGGYSRGEAFVARNVGLRSCWTGEKWTVRTSFLDHDNTWVPWKTCGEIDPAEMLEGMRHDARYIFHDRFSIASAPGEIGCLRQIYRPDAHVVSRGAEVLSDCICRAAARTRAALARPEVASLLDPAFLRTKADWDALIRSWLRAVAGGESELEWENRARRRLLAAGYDEAKSSRYLKALKQEREFLGRFALLYGSRYRAFNRSNGQSG